MAYVSANYKNNPKAPLGHWVCAPTSSLAPFAEVPGSAWTGGIFLCGQCVSYVKTVCPALPRTTEWKKGAKVRDNKDILPGTVIATFNAEGSYEGHAAIYDSQTAMGILVFDQWVTPPSPSPVSSRLLRWGAAGRSNNGDNFHVVE